MMIGRSDGKRIIDMIKSANDVEMKISKNSGSCSKLSRAPTKVDVQTTSGVTDVAAAHPVKNVTSLNLNEVTILPSLQTTSGAISSKISLLSTFLYLLMLYSFKMCCLS